MIGQTINGFQILRLLGSGGMGSVYEALDLGLERRVAIKVLNPELSRDEVFAERFRKEAMALARLNHPNVTAIYSLFRHEEQLFLVMELVEGERLDQRVRSHGGLPWPEAVGIACEILAGLEHAHAQGIVHRDVKPSNCLLTPQGRIKVTDFGIAYVAGRTRLTRSGKVIGTAEYIAPELILGREPDARADLYSLGAVLYEMVTGRVPFRATTLPDLVRAHLEVHPAPPRALMPQLPDWLERAILHALAKDPRYRFQTAGEMAAALRQGMGAKSPGRVDSVSTPSDWEVTERIGVPAAAPEPGPPPPSPPPSPPPPPLSTGDRKSSSRLILGATLFLLVAAVAIVGVALLGDRNPAVPAATLVGMQEPPPPLPPPEPDPPPPPPPEPPPEQAAPRPVVPKVEPPARDNSLISLCQLAARLQLAGERLHDQYRGDGKEAVDKTLLDQISAFKTTANRFQQACTGTEPRTSIRKRAAELVAVGHQLAASFGQSQVGLTTEATWLTIKDRLAELERAAQR